MGAKDNRIDLNGPSRLHDGWAYMVTLKSGKVQRVHDPDRFANVLSRWESSLRDAQDRCVIFSGAREVYEKPPEKEGDEPRDEIGPLDGEGAFLGAEIASIRPLSAHDGEPAAEAWETARAVAQIMGATAVAASDEEDDGEDGDEGEGAAPPTGQTDEVPEGQVGEGDDDEGDEEDGDEPEPQPAQPSEAGFKFGN